MNSLFRMGLLLSIAILTKGAAVQVQPLIHQLTANSFNHKTIGLMNIRVRPLKVGEGKIEIIQSDGITLGQVFFTPAHSLESQELVTTFKKATHSPTLDGYACIYGLHIMREYRGKKLCPLLFLVLKRELIQQGYTGLCLIADPYNVDLGIMFQSDPTLYAQHLEKLLLLYTRLGIEPQKDAMGNLITVQSPVNPPQKSVVCIRRDLAHIAIHVDSLGASQPIITAAPPDEPICSTRLQQFWNSYRIPISLGISGAVLVAAVLGWHSLKNRTAQTG